MKFSRCRRTAAAQGASARAQHLKRFRVALTRTLDELLDRFKLDPGSEELLCALFSYGLRRSCKHSSHESARALLLFVHKHLRMVLPQRRDGAASPAEGLFGDQPSRAGA